MKCIVLNTSNMPGPETVTALGIVVRPGDTVAIRKDLGKSLARMHPFLTEEPGSEFDTKTLRSGAFELRSPQYGTATPTKEPMPGGRVDSTLAGMASDRSMQGVGKDFTHTK